MNRKKLLALSLSLTLSFVLCACANNADTTPSAPQTTSSPVPSASTSPSTTEAPIEAPTEAPTEDPAKAAEPLYADLSSVTYDDISNQFEIANGWSNGSMFNCTWRKSNCVFEDGVMSLIIDKDSQGSDIPYSGGEFRSKEFYSYGTYEVVMKPISHDGVVSSFFTYTGPSDNNPWDEIDIEFLGKDTTKIQFNYFTNGSGNHEFVYDLGFDASEEFHRYAFEWQPDSITWYVDGEAVHTATKNIPKTPSKIMMNTWPGIGVDGWLKAFDGTTPLSAKYKEIKFTPAE